MPQVAGDQNGVVCESDAGDEEIVPADLPYPFQPGKPLEYLSRSPINRNDLGPLQEQAIVNEPGDAFEQEADRVAVAVAGASENPRPDAPRQDFSQVVACPHDE